MPVPTQCQGIAAEIDQLVADKQDLQSQLPGLTGAEKFQVLAQINRLTTQINAANTRLNACILAFSPGYVVDLVILDLVPGGSVLLPVTGHMWALSPPSFQSVFESEPSQNGSCSFVHGPTTNALIGFSVDEAGSPSFNGQIFRSGTLSALPTSSAGFAKPTIEIVAAPSVQIPASTVTAPASIPGLPAGVTLSGPPTATLTSGAITIAATGTFATTFVFPVTIPFTYTVSVTVTPSGDINTPGRICAVSKSGPGTLTTTAGGIIGLVFGLAAPGLEPNITGTVVPGIEAAVNALILSSVSGAIPPGAVVSMRRITITPSGISLLPAVGRFLP